MSSKKMKLLSAPELSLSHRQGQEQSLPSRGVKQFTPSHSWLETKHVESALEERKTLVEAERIEKWSMRACAIWIPDKNIAEVTRKVGKCWHTMGIEKGGNTLLQPEEALYMLETNVLELLYGDVALSIQQAYALLLGPSCTLAEYRTYSKLKRLGFYAMRYRESSSQSGPSFTGSKRRHESEKDTNKKRRVSNEPPNKKFDLKIELIDLEDDEPIENCLKFVPNIIKKESFTVIVAPDDLLPDNIKLHNAEYYINLRRLQEPGKGTRPIAQPPINWNQPFQGQPWYNNRPLPNYLQNMAQRFSPLMHQNNMFMRMQQFSRPVFNLNCFMSYQFPFLPVRLNQSYSAQIYARSPNPFMSMGRPMMAQNRPQLSHMAANSLIQRYRSPMITNPHQDVSNQQQRYPSSLVRNSSEEALQQSQDTKSLTPPPNPSVPKLKAKSWAEVKAQLATTIVTITLDEEDQTPPTTFADNRAFVQPEDCKSLDSILTKLQIFKKQQPKKEGEKSSLDIKFDVFQADPAFRKSEPSTPAYHVVVVSSPEALLDVSDISPDGVPLLYAIVQPDTINFFSLVDIQIPTIVS